MRRVTKWTYLDAFGDEQWRVFFDVRVIFFRKVNVNFMHRTSRTGTSIRENFGSIVSLKLLPLFGASDEHDF